jgi:hypothetical protein
LGDSAVPGSTGNRARKIRLSAAALGVTFALVAAPAAQAQNLLESLANALSGRSAAAPAPVSAAPSDSNPWKFLDRPAAQSGPKTSYCVRTCDGRFFPLPRSAGGAHMSQAQMCNAMCPAAETSIYSGGAIERAVSDKGKPYSALKTAFLFRDKKVDGCTCTRDGASGVAALDVKDDPTLRRGDIVVTREGPMVYTGVKKGGDRDGAFVSPEDYKGLSQSVRHELANMRIARVPNEAASLPVGVTPASLPVAAMQPVADTPRGNISVVPVHVTPVAEAFASFVR